jgi:hypothetical protein
MIYQCYWSEDRERARQKMLDDYDREMAEEREAIMAYEADREKKRSAQQNRAMHLWFRQIAAELNDGGYSVQDVAKLPISWTEHLVKSVLFMAIAKKKYGKDHTSSLTVEETTHCVRDLELILAENFGVDSGFPDGY